MQWTEPKAYTVPDLCSGPIDCLPCPDSPWLFLASVILPAAQGAVITAAMIDNGIRRTI
jgi:hypothetical protein